MIKKAALAAALAVSSSFATWDLYPVQDAGKGEAKLSFANYWMSNKGGIGVFTLGARYSVVNNLELALAIPYAPYDYDGKGNFHSFADGIGNLTAMARYQFLPNINGFLDVTFPVGNESLVGSDGEFKFHFGGQYSQKFGMVDFGSELGLQLETYGEDEVTPPRKLNAAVETDFVLGGMFTPFVRLDFVMNLGRYTAESGRHSGSYTGYFNLIPDVGVNVNLTQNFTLAAEFGAETGWYGDGLLDPLYHVGVSASYKF
ncbi:hypothetical protein [Fibrobacter sp. UWEL]|uniref:hypothetical protein n=1 Tax=Fibrobacter sp. UWEL TaxID=1896209 RepID=UPI000920B75A|nr:hypothetical protein [Fibrobacter sp. UWEL]SHL40969.1 hypothetical protein SAMN05720468_1273 [Fibrobacter sp. UWEL]